MRGTSEPGARPPPPRQPSSRPRRFRLRRWLVPDIPRRSLIWRVLAVNLLALAILAIGLLYLDRYRENLIESQLDSLTVQGRIVAAAIGEAAVTSNAAEGQDFLTALARPMVRRLAVPAGLRARLFAANGDLIADSRYYGVARGSVRVEELGPPGKGEGPLGYIVDAYEWVVRHLPTSKSYPPYVEKAMPRASDYREAERALSGKTTRMVRSAPSGGLVLSVAVPVQRFKKVLGVLMLSVGSQQIEATLRAVRLEILTVFAVVLVITIALSLWLASTIARPVRRLAAAAQRVRSGQGEVVEIPDFTARRDEIGNLSGALRDMTRVLWQRMEAIERFAADVAHEIKNPLTSLRSAVETAARVHDPDQQRRLMAIILDDVQRLDRLISDISDASRLDAELSRVRMERVDLGGLLATLVEIESAAAEGRAGGAPRFVLDLPEDSRLWAEGVEDRLAQVFRNLLANAVSFSPPGGTIRIAGERRGGDLRIVIEDQGPGLPPGKLEAIFERFYSERPPDEKFGTHSGLGLSISKQIVEAHRGTITAENIEQDGHVAGARFIVTLRAARATADD